MTNPNVIELAKKITADVQKGAAWPSSSTSMLAQAVLDKDARIRELEVILRETESFIEDMCEY